MPEGIAAFETTTEQLPTRRLPKGRSDPVYVKCPCSPRSGTVVLFYRYFQNAPYLPSLATATTATNTNPGGLITENQTSELASWYEAICSRLQLTGKIRVAREGYNCTIVGSCQAVKQFIRLCCSHWSFAGLDLGTEDAGEAGTYNANNKQEERLSTKQVDMFKPSPGCNCVFEGRLSVRKVQEICPLGQPDFTPSEWERTHDDQIATNSKDIIIHHPVMEENTGTIPMQSDLHRHKIRYLSPAEWHRRVLDQKHPTTVIDIRNKYESRLGHFVFPPDTSHKLILPPTRKFSELPDYLKAHPDIFSNVGNMVANNEDVDSKLVKVQDILTYCTGGIRCEKGARWIQDKTLPENSPVTVATLQGGIAAYLKWMDDNIAAGNMKPEDSLFKGRNYVFDARGSIGLEAAEVEHVARCIKCDVPASQLGKCWAGHCHLVLIVCEDCRMEPDLIWCCESCRTLDSEDQIIGKRRNVCECEKRRDLNMIGGLRIKSVKKSGWRRGKSKRLELA